MASLIASVSGGKDSTAMLLHLRDIGEAFRAVFFDTGWEHDCVYEYLDYLENALDIRIERRQPEVPDLDDRREAMAVELEQRIGHRSAMVRLILKKGMFPSRVRRFCTQSLKVWVARDVMREEHAAGRLPVNVVGIRAAESAARAKLPERELSTTLDCMVWRPLIRWSEQDVIDIHKRHDVRPNPLYLQGARRVGCWPCIQAGKAELRMLADDERRIQIMERLEEMVGELALERHIERGEAFEDLHPPAFFQHPSADEDGRHPTVPIREIIRWGQTLHGGQVLDRRMMLPGMNDGCLRWGMCDLGTIGEEA